MPRSWYALTRLVVLALPATSSMAACQGSFTQVSSGTLIECDVPKDQIFDGGPGKDGIPALTNPLLVEAGDAAASYLDDRSRVIGLVVDGRPIAVPLNIGWWHEIVNFDLGGRRLAVTHCPLTGSSLVFDRASAGGAAFGVSGLLYLNNLIMYDRASGESLWPQLLRRASCGNKRGTQLDMFPALELTWGGWKSLYPETKVVSSATGYFRDYTLYPYGNYDQPDNAELLFPIPKLDTRRPPKERVLGIPQGTAGGIAFPFGALKRLGSLAVVDTSLAGQRMVVFWDEARETAAAFVPSAGGARLEFRVSGGQIVDSQTNSTWRVDGRASAGPLAGQQLAPVAEAFVVYWFAWAAFYPNATLWLPPASPSRGASP